MRDRASTSCAGGPSIHPVAAVAADCVPQSMHAVGRDAPTTPAAMGICVTAFAAVDSRHGRLAAVHEGVSAVSCGRVGIRTVTAVPAASRD